MKFEIQKKALNEAIHVATKGVSSSSSLEILKGILIQASDSGLSLTGYNSQFAFIQEIPLKDNSDILKIEECGRVVLPNNYLAEVIKKLRGEDVVVELKEGFHVTISTQIKGKKGKSAKSVYNLSGLDPDSFPSLPKVDQSEKISIPCDVLKKAFKTVLVALSTNEVRPVLQGVHFTFEDNNLRLVSTDSHRLALKDIVVPDKAEPFEVIVPGSSIAQLFKTLPEQDVEATLCTNGQNLTISYEDTTFIARLMEGKYPDTGRIIPTKYETQVILKLKDFLHAVESCDTFKEKEKKLSVATLETRLEESEISLSAAIPSVGKAHEVVFLEESSGQDITISFNAKYVADALKAIDNDGDIRIQFGKNNLAPFLIKEKDNDSEFHMILPVRRPN